MFPISKDCFQCPFLFPIYFFLFTILFMFSICVFYFQSHTDVSNLFFCFQSTYYRFQVIGSGVRKLLFSNECFVLDEFFSDTVQFMPRKFAIWVESILSSLQTSFHDWPIINNTS